MFIVTEAEAAVIRAIYEQDGELPAAVELRRRFPGVGGRRQGAGMGADDRRVEAAAGGAEAGATAAAVTMVGR